MQKKQRLRKRKPKAHVFFNASVILAGVNSPTGESAKLLILAKSRKILGIISEIVLDEALKHSNKVRLSPKKLEREIEETFAKILPAPPLVLVDKYKSVVLDKGDAHVLASTSESGAKHLVTLDKKHLLVLRKKVKKFRILTPGELIEMIEEDKITLPGQPKNSGVVI